MLKIIASFLFFHNLGMSGTENK